MGVGGNKKQSQNFPEPILSHPTSMMMAENIGLTRLTLKDAAHVLVVVNWDAAQLNSG